MSAVIDKKLKAKTWESRKLRWHQAIKLPVPHHANGRRVLLFKSFCSALWFFKIKSQVDEESGEAGQPSRKVQSLTHTDKFSQQRPGHRISSGASPGTQNAHLLLNLKVRLLTRGDKRGVGCRTVE